MVVVCPHCNKSFENNRVNGMAMLEIASVAEAKKKMHCRLTLNVLERALGGTSEWPLVKKAVLDGYNDLVRDIYAVLGLEVE
jgi:hypothetical protein